MPGHHHWAGEQPLGVGHGNTEDSHVGGAKVANQVRYQKEGARDQEARCEHGRRVGDRPGVIEKGEP